MSLRKLKAKHNEKMKSKLPPEVVSKLIGDGAGTVIDAGGAVGEGAGKVLKGVGGLFGGEKEKK